MSPRNLEAVMCIAQRNLPEGYIISVRAETGHSWVELETPEGVKSFGADALGDAVFAALLVATRESNEMVGDVYENH